MLLTDLFSVVIALSSPSISILSSHDTLDFDHSPPIYGLTALQSIMIIDVDHDGRSDIVGVPNSPLRSDLNNLVVFYQKTDGRIDSLVQYDTLRYGTNIDSIDINWDGKTDVVVCDSYGKGIRIFTHKPDSGLVEFLNIPNSWGSPSMKVADLNNDSLPDIAALPFYTGCPDSFIVYYQGPKSVFDSVRYFPLEKNVYEYNWVCLDPADLNGDGLTDIGIAGGPYETKMSTYLQQQDGSLEFSQHLPFSSPVRMFKAEDVNNDGRQDLILAMIANIPDGKLGVFFQNDSGLFAPEPEWIQEDEVPSIFRIADMNLDGLRDLVVTHRYWNRMTIHLKKPEGGFHPYQLFPFTTPYAFTEFCMAVGDLNSDGRPDVAGCDRAGYLQIIYNTPVVSSAEKDLEEIHVLPASPTLAQNFPNPFNSESRIRFSLPSKSTVRLEIVNQLGERVQELTRAEYPAGEHELSLNAKLLSTGVYYYVLSTSDRILTKPMIVVK